MKLSKALPLLLLVLIGVYFVTSRDPLSAEVSGNVYWNEELLSLNELQRGKVMFRPVNGGANSSGKIDAKGSYSLGTGSRMAIAPGDYLVSVSVVEVVPPSEDGQLPEGKPVTPREYANPTTSGLTCLIKRGENVHDIHIKGPAYVVPDESLVQTETEDSKEEDPQDVTESSESTDTQMDTKDPIPEEQVEPTEEEVTLDEITSEIKEEGTN